MKVTFEDDLVITFKWVLWAETHKLRTNSVGGLISNSTLKFGLIYGKILIIESFNLFINIECEHCEHWQGAVAINVPTTDW